jgi:amidophosphoribosyltransferase
MSIHEECGVFGVFAEKLINAANICYYGLYALQHRGQESCGIVVNDDGLFVSHKDIGLVSEVFSRDTLSSLPEGTMAVDIHVMERPVEQTGITASRLK